MNKTGNTADSPILIFQYNNIEEMNQNDGYE